MRAVDTNVLVRVITRDNPVQVESAEEFIGRGAWVSHLVLTEMSWVLESVYSLTTDQIATAIDMLLRHEHLTIQDSEVVALALESFRRHPANGFSDHLIVEIARKHGHVPLGTFDKSLAKLAGTERLHSV
jgi:predicted nucleic-acid-binding protein